MKKIILFTIFIISGAISSFSQSINDSLTEINKLIKTIDNDKNYSLKTFRDDKFKNDYTFGSWKLTGYIKDDNLCKIVEWIDVKSGIVSTEYYIKNNKLIFVRISETEFRHSIETSTLDYFKQIVLSDCTYYFCQTDKNKCEWTKEDNNKYYKYVSLILGESANIK